MLRRVPGLFACAIAAACALAATALSAQGTMTISTVAGNGSAGYGGDGGPATLASLKDPENVAVTPDGAWLIADKSNNSIRRVAPDGTITTVAGTGVAGYNGDGVATLVKLNQPEGVAALADGGFLIADTGNSRIRQVSPLGVLTTVAGTGGDEGDDDGGDLDNDGDGGLAILAELNRPRAVAPMRDGGFLIADTGNHVVRRVTALSLITTVAGDGNKGHGGDGDPATQAELTAPDDVAPTDDGGFLIADADEDLVRKVSPNGKMSTLVGSSSGSGSGTDLNEPADVEPLIGGGFLIADHDGNRVLEVTPDGAVQTFAGTGSGGSAGDGGAASAAELSGPHGIAITADGDVLIADGHNHRVRRVDADLPPAVGLGPARPDHGSAEDRKNPTAEPALGSSVVVAPAFGMVKIKLPGQNRWALLEDGENIPLGSLVHTLNGSVVLTSELAGGQEQTGTFWGGVFQVRQARKSGVTDIVLRGGDFRRCRRGAPRSRPSAIISRRRRRGVRRLWAKDDHGRFQTYGRDSVATTRGTLWLTEDRCGGTLTRVREGAVVVRRRHSRGKGVVVKAGQRRLVRPRRPRR